MPLFLQKLERHPQLVREIHALNWFWQIHILMYVQLDKKNYINSLRHVCIMYTLLYLHTQYVYFIISFLLDRVKMAALTSIITEKFLTCSICFEIDKEPKSLPCLHSFCKDCIDCIAKKAVDKTKQQCPLCREPFIYPRGWATDLKTNFYPKNLIEIVGSRKEIKIC